MTDLERELLDRVERLEARVRELEASPPVHVPPMKYGPTCSCGGTAICPIHGIDYHASTAVSEPFAGVPEHWQPTSLVEPGWDLIP